MGLGDKKSPIDTLVGSVGYGVLVGGGGLIFYIFYLSRYVPIQWNAYITKS